MARMDNPPPYVQNQYVPEPPLPPIPVPPMPRASSSTLTLHKPNLATNYLFVKTRQEPVTGLFHIDPELQTVALDKTGATAVDRRHYNCKHRQRHRHHGSKSFKKRFDLPDPNAIFEARQGDVSLDLSIVARPQATNSRTLVQAMTRQGNIDIKIRQIHPQRRLNMEVTSRKGNILVLIPRSFSGYIQVYSKHGQLVFLPVLALAMNLVSRHEREAQTVVGDAITSLPPNGAEWEGDTLHVASRHGDVFVGYVDEDQKPAVEPGFWKKLMNELRQSSLQN
ncbi:hypothetical protein K439DRAFT_1630252 [Ramaria rubella]|nr:hypothetical protein K439DRAFT_1630252 [Ramaria rubella]